MIRRLFFTGLLANLLFLLSGCSDSYDDSRLNQRVDLLEQRMAALEELCRQMNTNIASLQTLVSALESNDCITAVVPIDRDGKTVGYTISFKYAPSITVYHGTDGKDGSDGEDGHTPVIGVAPWEGSYYWTIDGAWLTGPDGEKIRAQAADGKPGQDGKDGATPALKIEQGFWYLSTDGGVTWEKLGQATGDKGEPGADAENPIFREVTQDEQQVVFTLWDGTVITLPKSVEPAPLGIAFSETDPEILPGKTYEIGYTLSGADEKTTVDVIAQNGYKASVAEKSYDAGLIVITSPDPAYDEKIIVLVSDGAQRTIVRYIHIVKSVLVVADDSFTIEQQGGLQPVTVRTNIRYTVEIAEADRTWVSLVETRAPTREETLTFSFQPNPETSMRTAVVELRDTKGKVGQRLLFTQKPWGYKTVHVEKPASLESLIPDDEKDRLLGLILTGAPDSLDLVFMRSMPALISVDLRKTDLTTLPKECFKDSPLQTVLLPEKLVEVPDRAFYSSAITAVDLPASVTRIGKYAYGYCLALQGNLILPENLRSIGESAFGGCYYLTGTLTIPDSVTEIGRQAFLGCRGFTGLTLGRSLTVFPTGCFQQCSGMRGDLILPEDATSIEQSAFEDTGFNGQLVIGSKMKTIGIMAFCTFNNDNLNFYQVVCHAVTPPKCEYSSWGTGYYRLLVPSYASIEAYQAVYEWKSRFTHIETM